MMDKLQYYKAMADGTVPHPPIADLIGFKVVEADRGKIGIELVCNEKMVNSIGAVQGGIAATIADASMGMAAMTLMDDAHYAITVELKINFLRQPGMERLISTGRDRSSGPEGHDGRGRGGLRERQTGGEGDLDPHGPGGRSSGLKRRGRSASRSLRPVADLGRSR